MCSSDLNGGWMVRRRGSTNTSRVGSRLDRVVRLGARLPTWASVLGLGLMLIAIWYVVLWSGGTQRAMPHLFYFPVILAALPFGIRGTLVAALVATVLCGPLTPLNTLTGEQQQVFSWVFRGVMFALMGTLAALAISARTRYAEQQLNSDVREAMRAAPRARLIDESLVPQIGRAHV